ncbi:MAG: U32 family peptidase [Sedimentisphaerales bacterium]|nr:U32 family peptidase [Sedimentisphaerales bacterium]
MTIPLELVAPAGNADIGIAAIDHGADTVYIGAPKFSARAEAGNSFKEIERLITHAHQYYAKVYLALNTILTNEELPEALEIIKKAYDMGIDALIIQDVGLLEMNLPPVPLIASTQMHNDTIEKVQFLEAAGFKRVILARELSLEEIAAIRKNTKIELECFVHGALCVCYSGQCYMSQATRGRSSNRGICAQPCRHAYDLIDGDGNIIKRNKYLLSLKDLNNSKSIPELAAAGITSFKIEGRYKEVDYVKNVVASYRTAIDELIETNHNYKKASSGKCEFMFSPDAAKTFNRGYTEYFLYGRKEKIASIDTQKSIGQPIGTVTDVRDNYFRTDCNDLHNGDGLCFFNKHCILSGLRVNNVINGKVYPNKMKEIFVGTLLYRNFDIEFDKLLNKLSSERQIEIKMEFVQKDNSISLSVVDEDGNKAEKSLDVPFEPAKDTKKSLEQIKKQLLRTGKTIYEVTELKITPPESGFLVISVLNNLRRECLDELTKTRLGNHTLENSVFVPNNIPYPIKILDYHANVLNDKAKQFYERHAAEVTEPAFETITDIQGKVVMTTKYCIRHQLGACLKDNNSEIQLNAPLRIRDERNIYLIEFDCQKCQMSIIFEGEYSKE